MKANTSDLNVIHWEINNPLSDTEYETELTFFPKAGKLKNEGPVKSVLFKWTYRLKQGNEIILNYVAEEYYYFDDVAELNESKLKRMIFDSFTRFDEEFQFRTDILGKKTSVRFLLGQGIPAKVLKMLQSDK